jgi:hypothetical protein
MVVGSGVLWWLGGDLMGDLWWLGGDKCQNIHILALNLHLLIS